MEAAEGRVDRKLEELKALQATIEGLLVQHDQQEEEQMQSLVKIYESMKPKDAARIFEQLDMVVLLDVIGRMKERKSAPILAMMDPERAKEVTLELASRRSLPIPRN
jgi:flagellar motility protein MotE (MotC chaperone)